MNYLITLFCAVSMAKIALAGSGDNIVTGKVTDADDNEIPGAYVLLKQHGDSSIVSGEQTASDGTFIFEKVPMGLYILEISYLGYDPAFINFGLDQPRYNLGIVKLSPTITAMKEFEITAERSYIENSGGKTIYFIDQNASFSGNTLLELIEKMPGVILTGEGSIGLNGMNGVLIQIDGKQTYLAGQDLQTLLKSYQSSAIEKIEISSTGSVKTDASGGAGVINIVTKKNLLNGINGTASASYGQGRYHKSNSSLMVGLRKNKINIMANHSLNVRKGFSDLELTREVKPGTGLNSKKISSETFGIFPFTSQSPRLNIDAAISKSTSVSIIASGIVHTFKPATESHLLLFDEEAQLVQRQYFVSDAADRFGNWSLSNEIKHSFDTTGKAISVNLDYYKNFYNSNQYLNTLIYDASGIFTEEIRLHGNQTGNIKIRSFAADYSHPNTSIGLLESGIKSSVVQSFNDNRFYTMSGTNEYYDITRSNIFLFTEKINAAYLSSTGNIGKLKLTAGVRAESYTLTGEQKITLEKFSRNNIQFFPVILLEKTISGFHKLTLSINRRIDRPNIKLLNPFRYNVDATSFDKGNPALKPELVTKYEMNYSFNNYILVNAGYSRTKDKVGQVIVRDGSEGYTLQTWENIGIFNYYYSGLTISGKIFKNLKSGTSMNFFYGDYHVYGGQISRNYVFSFNFSSNNHIRIWKEYSMDVNLKYNHRYLDGYTLMNSNLVVSGGIKKEFPGKKGSISLTLTDLLNTMELGGITETEAVREDWVNNTDSRVISLNLSFRFGSENTWKERRHSKARDEINRAG